MDTKWKTGKEQEFWKAIQKIKSNVFKHRKKNGVPVCITSSWMRLCDMYFYKDVYTMGGLLHPDIIKIKARAPKNKIKTKMLKLVYLIHCASFSAKYVENTGLCYHLL